MKFAYADPPYLGCGEYYIAHHPDAKIWDNPESHRALIERLQDEYPDGWALSLSGKSLWAILPMCPADCRVAAWITASPRYAGNFCAVRKHFEPVVFVGGRDHSETGNRCADYIVTAPRVSAEPPRQKMVKEDIRAGKAFVGAKPHAFGLWIMDLLGVQPGDEVDDLFPGTGAVTRAIEQRLKLPPEPFGLFGGNAA